MKAIARQAQRAVYAAQDAREKAADNQDAAFASLIAYTHGAAVDAVTAQAVQTAWTDALAASNAAWKTFTAAERALAAAWQALAAAEK